MSGKLFFFFSPPPLNAGATVPYGFGGGSRNFESGAVFTRGFFFDRPEEEIIGKEEEGWSDEDLHTTE